MPNAITGELIPAPRRRRRKGSKKTRARRKAKRELEKRRRQSIRDKEAHRRSLIARANSGDVGALIHLAKKHKVSVVLRQADIREICIDGQTH